MGFEKNVASQKWIVFAFDRTDNTPKTGDAANITAKIALDDAAAGAVTDTNPTEIEDGYYAFDLTQAETNATKLHLLPESSTGDVQVIGCPAVVFTQPANLNDVSIASDGDIQSDLDGTVATVTTNTDMRGTDSAYTGTPPTAGAIADAVLDEALSGHTTAGTVGKAITDIEADTNELQTDDVPGLIAALDTVVDRVEADTQDLQTQIGTAGAGLTDLGGMSTGMKAEVNAEADTALSDYDGPTKAELDSGLAGLNDPTAGAIADAVLDEALSGHTTAGTLGKAVADTEADTNEIQGKLPTNNIMGSSDASDKDDEIDAIKAVTDALPDSGALTSLATAANQTTILARLGAFTGSGVNTVLGFFQALFRSDASTPSDIGGTFDPSAESVEALRDRGDAAWTTGGGGSISDILNIHPLIPESIDLADTASWRLGLMLINSLDDLPATAEITPGTISIDRKAIGGTSWSSVVSDAACSELAGLIYYDEVFDSGTGYAEGDSLRITFKSQKITVSANDYEISDSNGRIFYTEVRQTMRGTDSANTTTPPTTAAIATAIIEKTVDGTLTVETALKKLTAVMVNEGSRSGSVYTYRNFDDDGDEVTHTISTSARTVS